MVDAGGCPLYQAMCGSTCIPTSQDPKNCGGCGVTCAAGQVCSAGACEATCLPGLTACNGSCVDTDDDDANCGGCGKPCGTGKGCVAGACVPSLGATTKAGCNGGGPPISLGGMTAGCVAQTTFTWALCSCKDVATSGDLLVDGYDSTKGPYMPGGLGAGVGADGALLTSSKVDIWGAMWTDATTGLNTTGAGADVKQEVRVNGPVSTSSTVAFEEDAYVNGGIATSKSVAVTKTLTIPPGATLSGTVTEGALVHAPVSVPEPCDCAPSHLLPIDAWVAAAKAKNDDAAINLDPNALVGESAPSHVDLPCGTYYLTSISTSTPVTIAAHGNTALFIDGDVGSAASVAFVLDPTAQFDVVIKGGIASAAKLVVGSPNYPALSRTYVGSTTGLGFTGNWTIGGNVYAAYGPVSFSAGYTMYGAVFAGDFDASGPAAIHYDRAVANGGLCNPVPVPDGGTGTCSSCKDCGNQACNGGTCGACTTSNDCCAPLTCAGGTCTLLK